MKDQHRRLSLALAVLGAVLLFSAVVVWAQFQYLGLSYLEEGWQIKRHLDILHNTAFNPWQYRVLPHYLLEPLIRGLTAWGALHPIAAAFLGFRFAQNILLFLLAYFYYRRLGLGVGVTLIGMSMLAWGMTNALYDSDLQFSTYFDVAAYLLAGLVIAANRPGWIIPITAVAAFNRETSGLIPFLLIASLWTARRDKAELRRIVAIAAVSLVLFVAIYVGLRLAYGLRPVWAPYGIRQGLPMLKYNLLRPETYLQIAATLGIIPIMALVFYRRWPALLQIFFWTIVPIWAVIHVFTSIAAESRVFLVPQALVFIPAALIGLCASAAARASLDEPGQ